LAVDSKGLPYGIQLMTDRFDEKSLFEYAQTIENLKQ